ncbi:MAG TPA: 50S ribosomal protein L3 [Candidatus Paceibacterota bacterium]|nr:50S ribosomal protein L3 [Candidatus Paceibacterota bacterium]
MTKFILGKKIGMSQIFMEDKMVPVTLIESGPVVVVQLKTKEKDGYNAAQVGFGSKKPGKLSKALKKHMKDLGNFHWLREYKLDEEQLANLKVGDKIDASIFQAGEKVKISGTNKSKGFQGVVKRHGFHGGPKTHGQKNRFRAPGSIGATHPQHVMPGRRLPGRMGGVRITLKNRKIVQVDGQTNLMAIKGAVPGKKGDLLEITGK